MNIAEITVELTKVDDELRVAIFEAKRLADRVRRGEPLRTHLDDQHLECDELADRREDWVRALTDHVGERCHDSTTCPACPRIEDI